MLDFFKKTELIEILGFVLILTLIGFFVIKIFEKKWFKTDKELLIFKIKSQLIIFTIFLIIFYLKSSLSPTFNTFYYPEDLSDIEDKKQLLKLLQEYNNTIHETSELLHWFILLFATFFLGSIFNLLKLFKLKE